MSVVSDSVVRVRNAIGRGERVAAIHYSCESFFEVSDRPVAISAIGITEILDDAGAQSVRTFAVASAPENADPIAREEWMLRRFFDYLTAHSDTWWVHWNMGGANFGFEAIVTRFRFLTGEEPTITVPRDRMLDLDSAIEARYGKGFAGHPKMRSLFTLNGYYLSMFADGEAEARAFTEGNHGLCERSASTKSSLLARAAVDFITGRLQTLNSVGALDFAGQQLDAVDVVLVVGEQFLYVQRELARRHDGRATLTVNDEYDAQDLLRALLRLFFADVREEVYTPTYAGGASRIDFVIPAFELAIELKFARSSMTDKTLANELIIDRDRYAHGAGVRHLLCLVFDHEGQLRMPRALETDLARESSLDGLAVTVRIYDR